MKVILSSMMDGSKTVELADKRSKAGHQVIADEGNFFNPSEGVTVFVETPQEGAHPWVSYVHLNADGSYDFSGATRMPLEKTTIRGVYLY